MPSVVVVRFLRQPRGGTIPKKRQKWHGGRALLNRPGFQSTAAIVAEIEDTGPATQGTREADKPTYSFQLANCDRSISFMLDGFGFYVRDAEYDQQIKDAMENDLYKLDVMIETLQKFRDGVALEQKRYWRRPLGRSR